MARKKKTAEVTPSEEMDASTAPQPDDVLQVSTKQDFINAEGGVSSFDMCAGMDLLLLEGQTFQLLDWRNALQISQPSEPAAKQDLNDFPNARCDELPTGPEQFWGMKDLSTRPPPPPHTVSPADRKKSNIELARERKRAEQGQTGLATDKNDGLSGKSVQWSPIAALPKTTAQNSPSGRVKQPSAQDMHNAGMPKTPTKLGTQLNLTQSKLNFVPPGAPAAAALQTPSKLSPLGASPAQGRAIASPLAKLVLARGGQDIVELGDGAAQPVKRRRPGLGDDESSKDDHGGDEDDMADETPTKQRRLK